MLAILVLALYYPLAVYAYPKVQQMDKKLDIKYDDKFLLINAILKVIARVFYIFLYCCCVYCCGIGSLMLFFIYCRLLSV